MDFVQIIKLVNLQLNVCYYNKCAVLKSTENIPCFYLSSAYMVVKSKLLHKKSCSLHHPESQHVPNEKTFCVSEHFTRNNHKTKATF